MQLKFQKHIGDDVGEIHFYKKKKRRPPDTFYPTYYARI
jgi:hypothetical protein